ncbi:unnamed protein product, partial [Polarella glacialis]
GLAQTCFERLTDELGPTSRWAAEGSLLHIPVAVARAPSPSPQRAAEAEAPGAQTWSADLGAAPWEEPQSAPRPPATAAASRAPLMSGMALGDRLSTAPANGRLGTAARPSTSSFAGGPPPVFSAALGPALWEMEGSLPGPAPSTAAHRVGTAAGAGPARLGTGRPPTMHGHALVSR